MQTFNTWFIAVFKDTGKKYCNSYNKRPRNLANQTLGHKLTGQDCLCVTTQGYLSITTTNIRAHG